MLFGDWYAFMSLVERLGWVGSIAFSKNHIDLHLWNEHAPSTDCLFGVGNARKILDCNCSSGKLQHVVVSSL